jgi:hypothetical protein
VRRRDQIVDTWGVDHQTDGSKTDLCKNHQDTHTGKDNQETELGVDSQSQLPDARRAEHRRGKLKRDFLEVKEQQVG